MAQLVPRQADSEAGSAFSPPVPFVSCKFFLPGSGSTHPSEEAKKRKKDI